MEANIEVVEPKLFAGAVADEIVASIQEAINDHGFCSLVLAGGRTPGSIYRFLGLPPRVQEIDWSKVQLYWGDERWVPADDSQSNFRMVKETLLDNIPEPGPKVQAVPFDGGNPEKAAQAYAAHIAKSLSIKAGQVPVFDIVLLGIGEDGHTASIFPGSQVIHATQTVCHSVPHPQGGFRITLSPDALFSARRILFIVNGEGKSPILKRILEKDATVDELPARLYERAQGRVSWFVDSGAAKKLSGISA